MPVFILQTILLLLIAYILGCILGCLFHQWFGADAPSAKASTGAATAGAAAVGVAAVAAAKPAAAKPVATKPAEPVAFTAAPKPTAPPLVDDTIAKPEPAPKPAAIVAAPKAAPKPKPAPKPKAAPKPAAVKAAAPAKKDDLKRIRGIGKQNEARLNAVDVNYFSQIAGWSKKEQQEMGDRLAFPGRIEREEWVAQAKLLAAGKDTAFSKRVDKGEVASSQGRGSVGDLGKKPSTLAKAKASGGDNLTLIDGVGNAIEKKLNELGIFHFSQIAKWSEANEVWVSNEIGFPGRSQRENWVAESKILAAGGTTEHAQRVEDGKITTSRKSDEDEK